MALQPAQVELATRDAESIRTDFSFHRVGVAASGFQSSRVAAGMYKARPAPDTSCVERDHRSSIITGNPQTACRVAAGIAPSHHSND